jgi:serine/threonine protein kinase
MAEQVAFCLQQRSSSAADRRAEDAVDKEGYYHVQHGELINKRYKVVSDIGRGVFSCVLECVDEKEGDARVAIKVIKNNHTMNKAAEKEVSILQRIASDVSPRPPALSPSTLRPG